MSLNPTTSPEAASSLYWKRKLFAYLHDTPDKVLSIADHEERARRLAGDFPKEEAARKESDWAASAADRLPFPPSSETKTPISVFRHPLGKASIPLNEKPLPLGLAEEISQKTRPVLTDDDERATFLATWRFWRNWASSIHPDFALYPAETRLPDHTIWNHLAVTSAMQGCLGGEPWKKVDDAGVADRPCFLLFTIGPVQEFIARARSTRDLWSGSYLLSYLIGHVLTRVALDFGPDHVVFPNLCDVPLIDLLMKDEVWGKVRTGDSATLFDAFDYFGSEPNCQRLLTPALPNRFLAVLPAGMVGHRERGAEFASAESYAAFLAHDLKRFYAEEIGAAVGACASECFGDGFRPDRFKEQLDASLETHWQVLPWPDSFEEVEVSAASLPEDTIDGEFAPRAGLETLLDLCAHGADKRYLDSKGKPKNVAAGWSALYSFIEWSLDGTKAVRPFAGWGGGRISAGKSNDKDSLNGREEAVLHVGDRGEKWSAELRKKVSKDHLLVDGEILGASTLVKRLWPYTWLCMRHGFEPDHLVMPNTRSIAAHEPWERNADDEQPASSEERYFAVLALDGDSMGKWISGSRTPKLSEVLSEEASKAFLKAGADLSRARPLSPSWHLQFAEALGNFAQHAARRIVESFDGRLIYAGGDDVLALLPADAALECARALRLAFRGDTSLNNVAKGVLVGEGGHRRSDRKTPLFQIATPGFLRLTPEASSRHGDRAGLVDDPVKYHAIVPGPAADCSVGIAIAHFKSPLQDVVRAAQDAEKRAKRDLGRGGMGRSAVAVSLFKRSGEIAEWGSRWESGGLELYEAIADRLANEELSAKFPHRVCQLLEPYLITRSGISGLVDAVEFEATEIIRREFAFAIARQSTPLSTTAHQVDLAEKLETYLTGLGRDPQTLLRAIIGLCTTVAFAHRTRSTLSKESKGN
jgi:hypothetical protein